MSLYALSYTTDDGTEVTVSVEEGPHLVVCRAGQIVACERRGSRRTAIEEARQYAMLDLTEPKEEAP